MTAAITSSAMPRISGAQNGIKTIHQDIPGTTVSFNTNRVQKMRVLVNPVMFTDFVFIAPFRGSAGIEARSSTFPT